MMTKSQMLHCARGPLVWLKADAAGAHDSRQTGRDFEDSHLEVVDLAAPVAVAACTVRLHWTWTSLGPTAGASHWSSSDYGLAVVLHRRC